MSDRPEPDDYDEARLLAAIDDMLAESRQHGFERPYAAAVLSADRHGETAARILMWITGHWADAAAFEAADELLHGPEADPRRQKVLDVVHRLATGDLTWTELATIEKKALITRETPRPAPPGPDAVPLADAREVLATMLAEAGVNSDSPDPVTAWEVFKEFAQRPVAATSPKYVEDDMCLFEWGIYDWGDGEHFDWSLTRQFVIHDGDGDYDHMEQMHVTLLFNPGDPPLREIGVGQLWSDSDLQEWFEEVEKLDVFAVAATGELVPTGMRVYHDDV